MMFHATDSPLGPDMSTLFGLLASGSSIAISPPTGVQAPEETHTLSSTLDLNRAEHGIREVDDSALWKLPEFRRVLCQACGAHSLRVLPLRLLGVDTTYLANPSTATMKSNSNPLEASLLELERMWDMLDWNAAVDSSVLRTSNSTGGVDGVECCGDDGDNITTGEDFCSVMINPSVLCDAEQICFNQLKKFSGASLLVTSKSKSLSTDCDSNDESKSSETPIGCSISEGWRQFIIDSSSKSVASDGQKSTSGGLKMCFLGSLKVCRAISTGVSLHTTASVPAEENSTYEDSDSSVPIAKPMISSVVVRVLLSDKIRLGHVHINAGTRLAMGLTDFDTVTLTLLDPFHNPAIRPDSISARVISWNVLPLPVWTNDKLASSDFQSDKSNEVCFEDVLTTCREFQEAMISVRSRAMNKGAMIVSSSFIVPITIASKKSGGEFYTRHIFIGFGNCDERQYTILDSSEEFIAFVDDCCLALRSLFSKASSSQNAKFSVMLSAYNYASNIEHDQKLIGRHVTNFRDMHGLDVAKGTLLRTLLSGFLPEAILHRLWGNRARLGSPIGCIVVGPCGSGKSSLVHSVCEVLSAHSSTLIKIVHIDCRHLQTMKTDRVCHILTDSFRECYLYAPSLLCLDNLHCICGNQSSGADDPNGLDTTLLHRYEKIAMHIARLIEWIKVVNDDGSREASGLASAYGMSKPSHVGFTCNWSPAQIIPTVKFDITYLKSKIVNTSLRKTISVLSTATSTSDVHPRLLNMLSLGRKIISLSSMRDAHSRVAILKHAVAATHGAELQLNEANLSEGKLSQSTRNSLLELLETEAVAKLTEGYAPADLCSLAKRAISIAVKAQASMDIALSPSAKVKVSFNDINIACQTFLPASSVSLNLSSSISAITFASIGGYKSIKNILINTFQRPVMYKHLFKRSCTRIPRGVMLYGPPGNGKTMLAQAAGNSCGLAFISVRGPELLDKYIGSSEKAVRSLFERAKSIGRPCLIFFDEFESLGARRGQDTTGVTDRVVNQLLTFLDGVEDTLGSSQEGEGGQIYIVVATSRPDMVDPALLRPGRIETHAYVGYPSIHDKREIFEALLGGVRCSADVDSAIDHICKHQKSKHFTGADIKGIVNSAFLIAAQDSIEGSLSLSYDVDTVVAQVLNAAPYEPRNSVKTTMDDVVINSYHVMSAFNSTMPSITPFDMSYYDSLHKNFMNSSPSDVGTRATLV